MIKKTTLFLLFIWLSSMTFLANAKGTVFEYHPQNGYVLITPQGIASQGIAPKLSQTIQKLQQSSATIKSLAFTPDGKGWSLISSKKNYSDNVSDAYTQALKKLQSRNAVINTTAFNPTGWDSQHGFVIVHDKGYLAENIPSSLKQQLDAFNNQTQHIRIIKFTPDGGWSIISDGQEWSRMIQGQALNFLDSVHMSYQTGKQALAIGFNPENYHQKFGWLLITDKGYQGLNVPEAIKQALHKVSIPHLEK